MSVQIIPSEVNFTFSNTPPKRKEPPTALPIFIGRTARARHECRLVRSIAEFSHVFFGNADFGKDEEDSNYREYVYFFNYVRLYFDNGGEDCYVYSAGARFQDMLHFTEQNVSDLTKAIQVQSSDATLLCFPELALNGARSFGMYGKFWGAIFSAVSSLKNIFLLIDVSGNIAAEAFEVKAIEGLIESNNLRGRAAIYWPSLITKYGSIAPSSAIAAAIQLTDRTRGVWKAPANITLVGVSTTSVEGALRASAQESFKTMSTPINEIRTLPGRGVRIWGCRTMDPDVPGKRRGVWGYVQTSRSVSYIERHLQSLGRFAVFEPNNAITWMKLKGVMHAWLFDLWQAGALAGDKQTEAFNVLVGLGETMTDNDVAEGKLIVQISLALQYPAEFIDVQLHFHSGGSGTVADIEGDLA